MPSLGPNGKSKSAIVSVFGSKYIRWILYLIPLVIGLLNFIYRKEITSTWPYDGSSWPGIHAKIVWSVAVYWSLYPILPILFILNDSAKTSTEEMARALPTNAFISQFGSASCFMEDALLRVPRSAGPNDELNETISILLKNLLGLALLYDQRSGVRYAANVMYRVNVSTLTNREQLLYWHADDPRGSLVGALVLEKQYTAYVDGDLDPKVVEPLLFPLIKPMHATGKDKKWHILPGAPRALMNAGEAKTDPLDHQKWEIVDDVETATADMSLSEQERAAFDHYYLDSEEGKAVKSLISFPLFSTDGHPFAVLNIHCNKKDWLGGNRNRQDHCGSLFMPLVNSVGNVMELILFPQIRESRNSSGCEKRSGGRH